MGKRTTSQKCVAHNKISDVTEESSEVSETKSNLAEDFDDCEEFQIRSIEDERQEINKIEGYIQRRLENKNNHIKADEQGIEVIKSLRSQKTQNQTSEVIESIG